MTFLQIVVSPLFSFSQFSVLEDKKLKTIERRNQEKKNDLKTSLTQIKFSNAHALKCQTTIFVGCSFIYLFAGKGDLLPGEVKKSSKCRILCDSSEKF